MTTQSAYTVPLLPLRGILVYPSMVLHLDVGRDYSVQALENAMMHGSEVFMTTQKDVSIEEPKQEDLYQTGTLTKVNQMMKLQNGTIRVLVEGVRRAKIVSFEDEGTFYSVEVETFDERFLPDAETEG